MSTPEHVAMIEATVARQRAFFQTGATRPVAVRVAALHKLKREMQARETILLDALYADLHKSHAEGYMCELGLNLDELGYLARKLPQWAKPQRHPTPLAQFYSSSYQLAEPYGVVLVMSPWNYPYLLSLDPLFGAIAAGNCVVLKPSAYAPNTSRAMAELIAAVFPPDWVTVIQGGREQNAALLEQKFDYIFFTGSVDVGKMVMEKASRHLTPVTLELGGKSPVIVDRTANLPLTARRLAFGKILNAGQTCVAPDYCLVATHRAGPAGGGAEEAVPEDAGGGSPGQPGLRPHHQPQALQPPPGPAGGGEPPLRRRPPGRPGLRQRLDRPHPGGRHPGRDLQAHGGGDFRPHPAHHPLRHPGPGHRLYPPAGEAFGPLPLHPEPEDQGAHPEHLLLRRRLRQRHHHPPGHPPHALRRGGPERHGQLPRQEEF